MGFFFNGFSLFISRASGTFLLNMFDIVLGWIQLNWLLHSLVCSVAPDDSQLLFVLSCRCSMQLVNTFFFDLLIYLPLHEQSNWYTPGWLLSGSFGLFWHRMLYKFFPNFWSNSRYPRNCLRAGLIVTAIFFFFFLFLFLIIDFNWNFWKCSLMSIRNKQVY